MTYHVYLYIAFFIVVSIAGCIIQYKYFAGDDDKDKDKKIKLENEDDAAQKLVQQP